jgi:hypothetical protein
VLTPVYTHKRNEQVLNLRRNEASRRKLFLEPELFDESGVALLVLALQVLKMRAAVGHHLEETAAAVLVLGVLLQMRRKLLDALAQKGDLHLGAAGVRVMNGDFLDSLGFLLLGQHA